MVKLHLISSLEFRGAPTNRWIASTCQSRH